MLKIESPRVIDEAVDSALACFRRLKLGMRHKVRAAEKKIRRERWREEGTFLCSTQPTLFFFSHLFVLSPETERLEQAYTAQLTWAMAI